MQSDKELFFQLNSFAVIGHSGLKPFPRITYGNLRKLGKKVFPIDLSGEKIVEGDTAYPSIEALPEKVEGAIVEVPSQKTLEVVKAVAAAGIKEVWLHQKSDTPEVLEFCKNQGIHERHGGCAVMYTISGFTHHHIHKFIWRLVGKY
jgi:uncharacterized protein